MANGGVVVGGDDGAVTRFVAPTSRWTMTWFVMIALGLAMLVTLLLMLAIGTASDLWIVGGMSLFMWVSGSGMFAVIGWRRIATTIVFDRRRQLIVVDKGKLGALEVPFTLVEALRIEVRADENYGDDYNVMAALPGVALWIHQLSSPHEATAFVTRLAEVTGLTFDRQLTRRA